MIIYPFSRGYGGGITAVSPWYWLYIYIGKRRKWVKKEPVMGPFVWNDSRWIIGITENLKRIIK